MARPQKVDRHAHGCKNPDCKTYYEDACDNKEVNGLCFKCKVGHTWELLVEGRKPKDCCLYYSRPATKDEKKLYKLAGDAPWYICKEKENGCARVQIYQPGQPGDPRLRSKNR